MDNNALPTSSGSSSVGDLSALNTSGPISCQFSDKRMIPGYESLYVKDKTPGTILQKLGIYI